MKRNKSILKVLPCVLLCVAIAFPGMKATVFAEDRIGTDGTITENGAITNNEGIEETENDLLPGAGGLFYEDTASAAMDTSIDTAMDASMDDSMVGETLPGGSEIAEEEGADKEDLLLAGEDLEEDGNETSGDSAFPEGDNSEQVENAATADNDSLQEGNGDLSEDTSQPEMPYPAEDIDIPEMTEAGDEDSAADPAVIFPGEENAGTDQDSSEEVREPAGEDASSELTALPEESAQDEPEEITAEEPSMEAVAEEQSDSVTYDPAAGPCPLARELTYNGQAQELIDVEDIPEGTLCYSLDGEAFSPEIPTGTDAGDYIVCFRSAGEEAAQVFSLTVNISKADVIFTAPSAAE